MSFRLLSIHRFCVVNDGNESVPVPPNVEYHVSIHEVGIFEHAANFQETVPPDSFDNAHPRFDFVCRI